MQVLSNLGLQFGKRNVTAPEGGEVVEGKSYFIDVIQTLNKNAFTNIKINEVEYQALIDTGTSISVVDSSIINDFKFHMKNWCGYPIKAAGNYKLNVLGTINLSFSIANKLYEHTFAVIDECVPKIIIGLDFLKNNNAIINCNKKTLELISPNEKFFETKNQQRTLKVNCLRDKTIPPLSIMMIDVKVDIDDGDYILEPSPICYKKTGLRLQRTLITLKNKNTKA